jgi:hypothetical protein
MRFVVFHQSNNISRKGERKGANQESKSFRGTDTVGRDNMIQEL